MVILNFFFQIFFKNSNKYFFADPIVYPSETEPEINAKLMEKLMAENLSGSQLDLVMHGDGDPFAPGHSKPNIEENELNKLFLESERTGGKKQPKNAKENGEAVTETSTL